MTLVAVDLRPDEQKTLASIEHSIRHPPQNSRVFTITPMIAEALLQKYNLGNRPRKPVKIARYAEDMAAGLWALTGDTMKFSDAPLLRDGQNRLAACIRSGISFETHIVFGVKDEVFDRIDQGRNRNGSDVLAIAGYTNTTVLSGAVRWVNLIEKDRAKQRDQYEAKETLRLLRERYPTLPNFVQQGRAIYERSGHPQTVVVAMLYLFDRANSTKAAEFATAWETGNWAGDFKPLGLLQGEISSMKAKTSGRVHDVVRAALMVKAWNIFAAGRKGRQTEMDWNTSDDFPAIKA